MSLNVLNLKGVFSLYTQLSDKITTYMVFFNALKYGKRMDEPHNTKYLANLHRLCSFVDIMLNDDNLSIATISRFCLIFIWNTLPPPPLQFFFKHILHELMTCIF